MKRLTLLAVVLWALASCANTESIKSPCAGAHGSPCSRTPLPTEPMELNA